MSMAVQLSLQWDINSLACISRSVMVGSYSRSGNRIKKHRREFEGRYKAKLDNAYPRMSRSPNQNPSGNSGIPL